VPEDHIPIVDPVFVGKVGDTEVGWSFTVATGNIDVWLDTPQYVMLGVTPPGSAEYFIDNVAVLAPTVSVSGTGSPLWIARFESSSGTGATALDDWSATVPTALYGDIGLLHGDTEGVGIVLDEPGIYTGVFMAELQWESDPGHVTVFVGKTGMDFFSYWGGRNNLDVQADFSAGTQVSSEPLLSDGVTTRFYAGVEMIDASPVLTSGSGVLYLTKWMSVPVT
jgi:hypothetical protein